MNWTRSQTFPVTKHDLSLKGSWGRPLLSQSKDRGQHRKPMQGSLPGSAPVTCPLTALITPHSHAAATWHLRMGVCAPPFSLSHKHGRPSSRGQAHAWGDFVP